jgi:MarR family 2-MHQ and catechol resistance regulon transcriptional repressor
MTRRQTDDDLADVRAGVGSDLDILVVYNLLRAHTRLSPFIDADLRRQNLTSAQLNVLLALRKAGADGLLMGEIGQKLVVTKSNVTGLIDRLERQDLVLRAEHSDRRATVIRLTGAGAELLKQTVPRHAEVLSELTRCFSTPEKKSLIRLLSKLRRELRRRHGEHPS